MTEQCRVAEAELAHDVDWVEPNRPKAMFKGLHPCTPAYQTLLLEYAHDELTEVQEAKIKQAVEALKTPAKYLSVIEYMNFVQQAMNYISKSYIVDFLTPLHEKNGEDWLYENYGVYEPEEV